MGCHRHELICDSNATLRLSFSYNRIPITGLLEWAKPTTIEATFPGVYIADKTVSTSPSPTASAEPAVGATRPLVLNPPKNVS